MNLNEIKKRAAQQSKGIKKSLDKLSQAALAKLDDFRKSSVTQENSFAKKAMTDYRQLTSLTVAGALVFTSGIFAYQKVDFGSPEAQMAVNIPEVQEPKKVESVIPTEAYDQAKAEVSAADGGVKKPSTMIADRSIVKGSQPFILKTALEQIDAYRTLAFDGYTLKIEGKEVAFFASETEISKTLDSFKKQFKLSPTVEESYFKEAVATEQVRRQAAFFKGFGNTESVLNLITKGTDVEKIHTVADGESFWAISTKYGISVDNLIKANPNLVPERIKAGDKVSLLVAKPLLTLCTVETVTYNEEIPYTVRYKDDSKLYKGQVKVTVAGTSGKKTIVAKRVKENGVTVKHLIVSEQVVSNPKEQLVAKGTKAKPSTAATGRLAKPFSRGSFSSGYGRRWGRMHKGVDWSMPVGSPIFAADGGVVELAGYNRELGYQIIINHGNGLKTRYAHNSKLLVSVGTRVFKGQKIANSGNTGKSTGPHLHFEVLKNGSTVNPLNYVR